MDQISPPMRIVLAVAVVFLAAYMLVLKPKGDTSEPVATPSTPATASASDDNKASTSLGKAVEGARGAAAATEQEQSKQEAAGDATANAPSTTAVKPSATSAPATKAAKPVDPALAKLPTWLQKSIDHKVVAILFTNGKSADDHRTQRALTHAYTAHGKVVARAVPISRIAKYRPVAQGVDVEQSPTLMIIDRDRVAQSLVGYSSRKTIDQAVIDGLLATDRPIKHVKFLQTVQHECRQLFTTSVIGPSVGDTPAGYRKNLDAFLAAAASSLGTIRNAPVPKAYKPASAAIKDYLTTEIRLGNEIRSTAIGAKTIDTVKVRSINARADKTLTKATLELASVGVSSCN